MSSTILGLDIGGTGIKAALVDVKSGALLTERKKIATPKPAKPKSVLAAAKELISTFELENTPIGIGFPSVVNNRVCYTANNIHNKWIGLDLYDFFSTGFSTEVTVINDADAAGLAEVRFGSGKDQKGLTIAITIGTGIGSGVFFNGQLIPNFELGSLEWMGGMAERYVSNKIRQTEELSWEVWSSRLSDYLNHVSDIFSPDLIILGGGVSKKYESYRKYISISRGVPIKTAHFLNAAGVIGAAIFKGEQ